MKQTGTPCATRKRGNWRILLLTTFIDFISEDFPKHCDIIVLVFKPFHSGDNRISPIWEAPHARHSFNNRETGGLFVRATGSQGNTHRHADPCADTHVSKSNRIEDDTNDTPPDKHGGCHSTSIQISSQPHNEGGVTNPESSSSSRTWCSGRCASAAPLSLEAAWPLHICDRTYSCYCRFPE